jgi:hypothetical protein
MSLPEPVGTEVPEAVVEKLAMTMCGFVPTGPHSRLQWGELTDEGRKEFLSKARAAAALITAPLVEQLEQMRKAADLRIPPAMYEAERERAEALEQQIFIAEDSRKGWERRYHAMKDEKDKLVGALNVANSAKTSLHSRAEALEQRLAEATKALIELIALRRWLEENAGRMPDERADAYRIAKGSSHWGRAERIVAATLDTEHSSEPHGRLDKEVAAMGVDDEQIEAEARMEAEVQRLTRPAEDSSEPPPSGMHHSWGKTHGDVSAEHSSEPPTDHACFDCGHPVSRHSGQAAATGCRDCDCQRWFNVYPAEQPSKDSLLTKEQQLRDLLGAVEKQQAYTRMCVEGSLNTQLRDLYLLANEIRAAFGDTQPEHCKRCHGTKEVDWNFGNPSPKVPCPDCTQPEHPSEEAK